MRVHRAYGHGGGQRRRHHDGDEVERVEGDFVDLVSGKVLRHSRVEEACIRGNVSMKWFGKCHTLKIIYLCNRLLESRLQAPSDRGSEFTQPPIEHFALQGMCCGVEARGGIRATFQSNI